MVYVFVETLKKWKNLTTKFKFFQSVLIAGKGKLELQGRANWNNLFQLCVTVYFTDILPFFRSQCLFEVKSVWTDRQMVQ